MRRSAAFRVIAAGSAVAVAVAVLLPLHSAAWSHDHELAAVAGAVVTAQTGAHDTHRHPLTAGDLCEACVATTQTRTAPVKAVGPRLEAPFGEAAGAPVIVTLLPPAAPARAHNHSRAPPTHA